MTRVEERGTRMEYATRERVWWFGSQNHRWTVFGFGPQNLGGGSEEEGAACGGITEVASRQSRSMQEAWPSDRQKTELDHNALGLGGPL